MKRSEFAGMTVTALTAAAVVLVGKHFSAEVETATEPLVAVLHGHSPLGVFGIIAAIASAFCLAGFTFGLSIDLVRCKLGLLAEDIAATLMSGLAVVLLFYSAVPAVLMAVWLAAMLAGGLLAQGTKQGN